jgi:hypothetical protein
MMMRSHAALLAFGLVLAAPLAGSTAALAQGTAQCNDFMKFRDEAQKKATVLQAALKRKAERPELCKLATSFSAAEGEALKFLVANKTWCGVPDQAITGAKTNHAETVKFKTMLCSEAAPGRPKPPSLSDAISTPSVDDASNTKTGRGTLDTLTGNPLAR